LKSEENATYKEFEEFDLLGLSKSGLSSDLISM